MRRVAWLRSLPFLLMHAAAFAALLVPFNWELVALAATGYFVRMFAITAGYHRYFAHRSYRTSRAAQFLLAFVGGMSVQKGALWWAANHRLHHRRSDQENDLHSPLRHGFWWSHVGWILSVDHDQTHWEQIPDLAKYPELRFLNSYPIVPVIAYAALTLAIAGLPGFIWGFVVSTVVLWHGTFTINSLSHVFGTRRYATADTSRNNGLLALITLGEGWHNNHHCYMSSVRQGFFWWELDVSFSILKALSWVGITWDLRVPPLELLEAKRIDRGTTDPMPLREPRPRPLRHDRIARAKTARA